MGLLKDEMPKEMEIIRSFLQEKDEYRNRFSYEKARFGFSIAILSKTPQDVEVLVVLDF